MRLERSITMPNEILQEMKDWLASGELKSIQHQEFVYTYYWLLTYLWRYALYAEQKLTQSDIKRLLGFNPNEKRLNYIMKKDGLLDIKEYTSTTKDFPISWSMKKSEQLSFDMLHEINQVDRGYLLPYQSPNYFVKSPVKHMGNPENEGIFWNSSDTHIVNGEVFTMCMNNRNLGCAGFYLYGVLVFIRDKSKSESFLCSNKTLLTYTSWNRNKLQKLANELVCTGLIEKNQGVKAKGSVNEYIIN